MLEILPKKFSCRKKVRPALLSPFGSTYLCEQIILHLKPILNDYCNRLTVYHSEACVQPKVTKCNLNITELSKKK